MPGAFLKSLVKGLVGALTMYLTLDKEEAELLEGLLERCLADLREEIHHTRLAAFKTDLKADEAMIRGILSKLSASAKSA